MTQNKKFPLPTSEQEDVEEALGVIWHKFFEEKKKEKEAVLAALNDVVGETVFRRLVENGFVEERGTELVLTSEGERLARTVTRRHRLAERLLSDVLNLERNAIDPNACQLEHIISPEVTESICALLGHPKQCPHGSPIPSGECCEKEESRIEPIVVALDKMKAGEGGKIAYVLLQNHPELHKLLSLGVVPGTEIHLHQVYPAYVLELGESQVARNIFVRKA
jgi:DtxR family transcriptional regulator, Mn-dependent transcriptional regulator